MGQRSLTKRAAAGALATALALAGAACGDDDDDAEGSDTTAEAAGGDEAAFCDALVELTLAFNQPEPPSGDAVAPLTDALEVMEANAPEDLADEVALMVPVAEAALAGDPEAFDDDAAQAASLAVDGFAFEECGAETGEISTVDYAFEGIPETVPAGLNIVRVTNEGGELHEVVLLRRNDDVTAAFPDLLSLPQEEAQSMVSQAGFTFVGEPGATAYLYADLEPGDYAAVCFLPVGATDFGALEGLGEDAPPHAAQGMVAEFTVSG